MSQRSKKVYKGTFRNLRADCWEAKKNHKVIVLANAFIENSYWYQVKRNGVSFAEFLFNLGFDVHILSFPLNVSTYAARDVPVDASFREIVCSLLPQHHEFLTQNYETIHYVGHSYGTTILIAFLLGYSFNAKSTGRFYVDVAKAEQRQGRVSSFVSMAGLFKLQWIPEREGKAGSFPLINHLFRFLVQEVPLHRMARYLPLIPTGAVKFLAWLPENEKFNRTFSRFLSRCGFNPIFWPDNTDYDALKFAMLHGSNHESLDAVVTVLSLYYKPEKIRHLGSKALIDFSKNLKHFTLPILFIQGELDFVTSAAMIKHFGYDRVGSSNKKFVVIPKTGHQDLLTAKDPQVLLQHVKAWFIGQNREAT